MAIRKLPSRSISQHKWTWKFCRNPIGSWIVFQSHHFCRGLLLLNFGRVCAKSKMEHNNEGWEVGKMIWVFPKIGVPQNGWWKSWKTLLNMGWFRGKTHYFRLFSIGWFVRFHVARMSAAGTLEGCDLRVDPVVRINPHVQDSGDLEGVPRCP